MRRRREATRIALATDPGLQEVIDELHLDRALFNPPAAVKVGRRVRFELGVYQNLREEIMRRLLERKISRFDGGQIDVDLQAELQVAGCLVLPKSLPQVADRRGRLPGVAMGSVAADLGPGADPPAACRPG